MRLPSVIALFAALLLSSLTLFSTTTLANDEPPRLIEISGQGEVKAVPDIITTTFSFSEQSRDQAGAKRLVDTQVTNLMKLLKKLGIAEKDVSAAQLQLYPQYDYKRQRELIGYQVQRNITIKVRELENYPKLLEGAVGIGATHSGGITMDYSQRKLLQQSAMLEAFKDAKRKAKLLAKEAGGTLGTVLSIREQGCTNQPQPRGYAMLAEAKSDASYPTGEQTIRRQIFVTFELKF